MSRGIIITFTGLNETQDYLSSVQFRAPQARDDIARDTAFDVQKGARFRLTTRMRRRDASTGNLWNSIRARQMQKGQWEARFSDGVVYGPSIERGQVLTGWQFIPVEGKGRRGEGFMIRKPGAIHVIHGENFFGDAVASTISRIDRIIDRRMNKLIQEGN